MRLRLLLLAFVSCSCLANSLENQARDIAVKVGISPILLKSICKTESNFQSDAIGDDGRSIGVCQIRVTTALQWYPWFLKDKPEDERFKAMRWWLLQPVNNMTLSAKILKYYLNLFNGNEVLAIMAYNGGPEHPLIKYYLKTKKFMDSFSQTDISAQTPQLH